MCDLRTPDLVFADAAVAEKYVTFRPQPPPTLITKIMRVWNQGAGRSSGGDEEPGGSPAPGTLLVDVGCGSGQNTQQFASYFDRVVGIDVSPDQLKIARQKFQETTNLSFEEGSAEKLPFGDGSVDMVTVCAAVHWFNLRAFYAEVDRVLRPGGVLAVYSYLNTYPLYRGKCLRRTMVEIRESLSFWTPQHDYLKTDYSSLPPAYEEDIHVTAAEGNFEASEACHLSDVLGFISSWSALAKHGAEHGPEAIQGFLDDAKTKLLKEMDCEDDDPEVLKRHRYFVRMWRKPLH